MQADQRSFTALHTLLHDACNRPRAVLGRHQSADQAGFRKTFRTTDLFMTFQVISQKSREWRTDMWVAAMDFKKAFNFIQLRSVSQDQNPQRPENKRTERNRFDEMRVEILPPEGKCPLISLFLRLSIAVVSSCLVNSGMCLSCSSFSMSSSQWSQVFQVLASLLCFLFHLSHLSKDLCRN